MLWGAVGSAAAAAPNAAGWAHVGNTYNSAIFVDREILSAKGPRRTFRTLHINTQPSAGWVTAEHRGTIDCEAQTLLYQGVTLTKTDGSRQALPSSVATPFPFPARGVMRTIAASMCSGKLDPAIEDPATWTQKNFRPG
jgi:hypothetical protein